jgi:MFS family permease
MIVSRFFNGLAGSAFLSVAGGTVGDLFDRHELSAPMMLYTASPFIGPEVGPLYVSPIVSAQALTLSKLALVQQRLTGTYLQGWRVH